MNQRRTLIQHNDKTIIFLDHTYLAGEAYVRAIEESIKDSGKSDMLHRLILVDATGSVVDKEVLNALKRLTSQSSGRIMKVTVLGISGIQKFFMRTIAKFSRTNIAPFNSREEALDWLTS